MVEKNEHEYTPLTEDAHADLLSQLAAAQATNAELSKRVQAVTVELLRTQGQRDRAEEKHEGAVMALAEIKAAAAVSKPDPTLGLRPVPDALEG